jgi:hypothetical protein
MRGERGSSSSKRGRTMRRGNPDGNEAPPPRYRSRALNFVHDFVMGCLGGSPAAVRPTPRLRPRWFAGGAFLLS